jgi:ABC-2 type transport system permease protein
MQKIVTIVKKEWAEIFKNRMVLFSVAFLPLIMTAIPLGIVFSMRGDTAVMAAEEIPEQINAFCSANLSGGECFQVYLVSQFMLMFMILPLAIPSTISAYSVIGEKTNRTLEPLLATPISVVELLVGKALAALIPAMVATYAAFALFALGSAILIPNRTLLMALLDPRWLIAIGLVGPLLSLAAVDFSVMVSSRVTDPRVAEQMTALLIIPVLAVFFGQMAGLFIIDRNLILIAAVALILIDAVLTFLATQIFQRETILTRWK